MNLKCVAILALFAVICAADEAMKCLDDNDDYLVECFEVLKLVESIPTDTDPKPVLCSLFGLMSYCVVGRSTEKCGEAGGEKAAETLAALLPDELQSCDEDVDDSVVDFLFSNLLDSTDLGQSGLLDRKKRSLEYRKKRQPNLEYRKKRQRSQRSMRMERYRKRQRSLEYRK